jgi:opacity protein-like surface antigen
MRRIATWGACTVLLGLLSGGILFAEDTRKKWQFGFGISYWSTDDNIRSNAATAYAPVDPTQAGNLPSILFFDPRPDANELNEPTIQDDFKLDFNASFGLSRWFAVELSTSYFKGDVGNIEFYSEDRSKPASLSPTFNDQTGNHNCGNPSDPRPIEQCFQLTAPSETRSVRNAFVPVGKITEMPVMLSGVVRFRPESPFDPYVGAGVGYIFASLDTQDSSIGTPIVMTASDATGDNRIVVMRNFQDVQSFTNGLVVENIRSGPRGILTYPCVDTGDECLPTPGRPAGGAPLRPLRASVEDGMEWHLMGGVDYYFNEHFSIYVDGRYVWARTKIEISIDGQEQINSGIKDFGCEDVSGLSPTDPVRINAICRTVSSPNGVDISDIVVLGDTVDDIQDLILLQGGNIRLGGFSLGLGVKVTF